LIMSNGARHVLGVVAGLLLPPLIAAGLWYGVGDIVSGSPAFGLSWLGPAVLAVSGLVFAFLAGSRMSPLASLLGGLAFTALGVVASMGTPDLRVLSQRWLPAVMDAGFQAVAYTGVLLFLGVALLVVSMFPSRWRSSEPPVYMAEYGGPSPYLPHDGPEDTTRPMYRE
jgi:hypothetical protein